MRSPTTALLALALALAALAAPRPAVAQLIGFYEFEGNGNDSSGRGNTAQVVFANPSTVFTGQGRFGNAAYQSSDTDSTLLFVNTINATPGMTTQVTFGGWVYLNDATGYESIIQADGLFGRKLGLDDRGLSGAATGTWAYAAHGGRSIGVAEDDWHVGRTVLGQDIDNGWRAVVPGGAATAGNWQFVAATYDQARGVTTVYDGSNRTVQADSFPFVAEGRGSLHLGSVNGQFENLHGRLDNLFVFDGALSPQQIATLRDASNPLAAAQSISTQLAAARNRTWKVDFQPTSGIAAAGIDGKEAWNTLTVGNQDARVTNLALGNLRDTAGQSSAASPDFALTGTVSSYNWSSGADPAAGDYIYWGGVNQTSASLTFELADLDPDKVYSLTPIGGGVVTQYELNNERRRFLMNLDTDGDGARDTTRMVKMGRGAHLSFTARPDATGRISGSVGAGGDSGSEANWGGFILEELGATTADRFKLTTGPAHRYGFGGGFGGVGAPLTDSAGGAHGTIAGLGGAFLDGQGRLVFEEAAFAYGELPPNLLDNFTSVSVETWFEAPDWSTNASTGFVAPENLPLFSFGDGGGEVFQQLATGDKFTPFTFNPDFHHNAQLRTDEAPLDADVFIGDNRWAPGHTQHAVVTFTPGVGGLNGGQNLLTYYLNGTLIKQALTDATLGQIDFTTLLIGANQARTVFNQGTYDELRVYDYALDPDQVVGNYYAGPDVLNLLGPLFVLGDMNGDGAFNALDIDPFVLALIDRVGFDAAFPLVDADLHGDFDLDGLLTTLDIDLFVGGLVNGPAQGTAVAALLAAGLPVSVPEPGAAAVLLPLAVLAARRGGPARLRPVGRA